MLTATAEKILETLKDNNMNLSKHILNLKLQRMTIASLFKNCLFGSKSYGLKLN